MKKLTKAEEPIMHILWRLEKAVVKDILEELPDPKPAITTVSTIVRILEDKGFVGHESFGRTHVYHPIVSKEEYGKKRLRSFLKNYFSNSPKDLVSFLVQNEDLSIRDLDELINKISTSKKYKS